jgi:hypothetical protein
MPETSFLEGKKRGRPKNRCYKFKVAQEVISTGKVIATSEEKAEELVTKCDYNPEEVVGGCENIYEDIHEDDIGNFLYVTDIEEIECDYEKEAVNIQRKFNEFSTKHEELTDAEKEYLKNK